MEKAFDTNTSVFHDAFKMFEVQQSVIFRILQDVFNGQVRVKGVTSNEDGVARATVDVDGYIKEHLDALTTTEEAPVEEKSGPGSILATLDDERPIEFGGDAT
jgi:hypothetical protein